MKETLPTSKNNVRTDVTENGQFHVPSKPFLSASLAKQEMEKASPLEFLLL